MIDTSNAQEHPLCLQASSRFASWPRARGMNPTFRAHQTNRLFLLSVALLALVGCRTYMPYVGHPMSTTSEAMKFIWKVLEQQPGSKASVEIQVTEEKFRMLRSQSNWILGTGGLHATTIYYSNIGDVLLTKKGKWVVVKIFSVNGAALLYVYAADQRSAETFVDALETMRRAASEVRE